MCANYSATKVENLSKLFQLKKLPDEAGPDEVFPGDLAPMIYRPRQSAGRAAGDFACQLGVFGMVPQWAETKLARHTYNARSETVAEKPSFRHAWQHNQFCLIMLDAFFEPRYTEDGQVERCRIAAPDGRALAMAGIWEYKTISQPGQKPNGLYSFSMLTINADTHPLMRQFHKPGEEKRMPVILDQAAQQEWLAADNNQAMFLLQAWDPAQVQVQRAPRAPRAPRVKSKSESVVPEPVQGSLF